MKTYQNIILDTDYQNRINKDSKSVFMFKVNVGECWFTQK